MSKMRALLEVLWSKSHEEILIRLVGIWDVSE